MQSIPEAYSSVLPNTIRDFTTPNCITCGQPCIVCPECGFAWCAKILQFLNCQCCGHRLDIGDKHPNCR